MLLEPLMRAGVQAFKCIPVVSLSGINVSSLSELKLGSDQLLPVMKCQRARPHLSLTARLYDASTASRVRIEFDNPRYLNIFLQNKARHSPTAARG